MCTVEFIQNQDSLGSKFMQIMKNYLPVQIILVLIFFTEQTQI